MSRIMLYNDMIFSVSGNPENKNIKEKYIKSFKNHLKWFNDKGFEGWEATMTIVLQKSMQ